MKTVIALASLLVLTSNVHADKCWQKTITVCESKGKVKKKVVVVPIVAPKVIVVEKKVPYPVLMCPGCPPEGPAVVSGHFAVGFGAQDPFVSGMIGLRVRFPKANLGFEVFSALQYGVGFQFLPYVYQGSIVRVHVVDPGFLITGSPFFLLGNPDVPRRVDLILGAGVEVKLTCHLDLALDWRVGIPDPSKLGCEGCVKGRKLDAGAVVGNAFASSQLFLGLLIH